MNIIIVGGGKVGYYLTKTLSDRGHDLTLIDTDKKVCEKLANELDIPVFFGDGTTTEVLDEANANRCDALISVTGNDEDNLICCQLAKKVFYVPKTLAKVNNPKNASVMKQLGIDITISATDNIVYLLEREVDNSSIKELLSFNNGEAIILEVTLPEQYKLSGKTLSEINIPEQSVVISIQRGSEIIIPRGNTWLKSKDKILIMTLKDKFNETCSRLKIDKKNILETVKND